MTEKKKKKLIIKSTQSFNPILGIKDGIIVGKNGEFCKLMEISPINFNLRSASEQDDIISAFSSALRIMPRAVHLKVVNTPSDITPYIDDLIARMYDEPNQGCKDLLYDQMQLIHRIGTTQTVSRRFFLSFGYEKEDALSKKPTFAAVAETLNRQARSIKNAMESCGNTIISTDDNDYLMSVLYGIMSRTPINEALYKKHKAEIMRSYEMKYGKRIGEDKIPTNYFISPDRLDFSISPSYALIDGKYVMYCYIPSDAYPTHAFGGWTQILFSTIDGVDVDIWIEKEDIAKVSQRLRFELLTNRVRENSTEDLAQNYESLKSALQSGYYLKAAIAAGDDFCYLAAMITITADSAEELKRKYKLIKDAFVRNDLKLHKCLLQQREAYLSSLPLPTYDRNIFAKSRRNITGSQAGSIYPFTAYELNDEGGIFFGVNPTNGSPVFLNIFDRSKYNNANMLILGPSGAGKTYTLLSMLLRMRQKGLQIYTIAPFKGSEFMRACTAVGGEFVRIAPGSAQNINIMEIRKNDSSAVLIDGEVVNSGSILTGKIQQIERLFSILLKDMTVQEGRLLDDALINTYKEFGITVQNKSLEDPDRPGAYKPMPILGDLYRALSEKGDSASRLCEALSRFVTGSAKSFNQPTNVDLNNKFVVLDVSEMTNEMLPIGMFIALDFVLDAAKADKTKNKVIAIDEMWRLMVASSLTSEFTVEVFKIIRGYGGSAIGATQDLDDVLKDEAGAAIINNAKFKFFLPMERKEAEAVASIVDITSEEMKQMKVSKAIIPGSERKMLLVAGSNHVFVSVRTSDREHDLITTNAEDLARIAREKSSLANAKG